VTLSIVTRTTLKASADFHRIASLPRRAWDDRTSQELAAYYTAKLRTHGGTWNLRPLQAIALHETGQCRGLLAAMSVGSGKTLLSLLAPVMVGAKRPVILLPAALVQKTRREMGELMKHWQIPRHIQFQSYETLGREGAAEWLQRTAPDMIIGDEVHRLKNARAAVTRRVTRYMRSAPHVVFVGMSGTLYRDDIEDFSHIAEWALRQGAPIPLDHGERMEWSECLGVNVNPLRVIHPGPLLTLATQEDYAGSDDPQIIARKAFRRRLRETPGVVCSPDNDGYQGSLYIRALEYTPNHATETNFHTLRTTWETPDRWALSQAVDVWRTARQLALGLHYVWSPRPPDAWMDARRAWAKYVRDILSRSRSLDSELQVRHAVENKDIPGIEILHEWYRQHPTFQIHTKEVWHDDSALIACEKWIKHGPGIVWTEHSFFAHELSRRTGVPYFGEQGVNAQGLPIEQADPRACVIASIYANGKGRNLQAWNRNLVTSPPTGQDVWEQLIGRTHRNGQRVDSVTFDVMIGCREHWDAFDRAVERTHVTQQVMGSGFKLLIADIDMPSESEIRNRARSSIRWDKSNGKEGTE
jgi:hypothetical protein